MFVKAYNQDCFYNTDFIRYVTIEKHSGLNHSYLVVALILIGTSLQTQVIGKFDNHDDALRYVETLVKSS